MRLLGDRSFLCNYDSCGWLRPFGWQRVTAYCSTISAIDHRLPYLWNNGLFTLMSKGGGRLLKEKTMRNRAKTKQIKQVNGKREKPTVHCKKNNRCPWKLIGNNWLLSFIFSSIYFFKCSLYALLSNVWGCRFYLFIYWNKLVIWWKIQHKE